MAAAIATAITTVIPSLAGYTAAVTAAASVALYAGTAYASYLITQAQQPKEKVGTKMRFSFGGDVPQSYIIGETETAGSLVYAGSWGTGNGPKNAMLVQVFCLSDMPSSELRPRIWINGEKDSIDYGAGQRYVSGFSIGYPVAGKRKGSDDRMWIKFLDGSQTTADGYLRDKFGALSEHAWTADHIGRGRTLVIVTTKYDKVEPDSIPLCRFVVRGIALYNPKKDISKVGGTHVWGDRTTYEWDNNAGVIAYNLGRGIYYSGEWVHGGRNWHAWQLDEDSFTASINASNDDIALKGGGTQKRWTLGGEISCDSSVFDTFGEINAACNGRLAVSGGKLFFDCGPYGAAEFVFTDGELFVNETIEATLESPVRDMYNTIVTTYCEPDIGGEMKAIKPKSVAAYVAADGGIERKASPSLRLCRDRRQAQRAAMKMLHDNRRTLTRQVIMGPERRDGMRANIVAGWDSSRYQYSAKKFIIGDTMKYPTGVMLVELREINPSDDSWNPVTDEDDIIVGTWSRVVPAAQVKPITVEQWPIKTAAGAFKAPGLRINWNISTDDGDDAKRMRWQLRLLDSTEIMAEGSAEYEDGFAIINKGLVKNEAYQVRTKLVPISDFRATDFTGWADTTVYPGGLTYILAPNASEVSEAAPPNISPGPSQSIITRVHRSNQVRQRVKVDLDISSRDATESYRVRIFDITDNITANIKTDEFPIFDVVQSGHSYSIRVAPVSRFGVIGAYTTALTTGVIAKKSGSVPAVSGESITTGHRRNAIEWDAVDRDTYPDFDETEIQRATNSGFTTGLKTFRRKSNSFNDVGLGNEAERYYRVRHLDSSGNPGSWSGTLHTTTVKLINDDYDLGSVGTGSIYPNSIIDGNKAKIIPKQGKWTVSSGDNSQHTQQLFGNLPGNAASVANESKSPILVNWDIKIIGSIKITGGTKGYIGVEATVKIKHLNSGMSKMIGKIRFGAGKDTIQRFVNSQFFPIADGATAKFQVTVTYKKQQGGITGEAKFHATGAITMTRWKR